MLFNTIQYLYLFLPLTVLLYVLLGMREESIKFRPILLLAVSFTFYASWNTKYLLLLFASITVNFLLGKILYKKHNEGHSKIILKLITTSGIVSNLAPLFYYKYFIFLLETTNNITKTDFTVGYIILPLAISFFTFQQISYLIDCSKGHRSESNFIDYALFVSFFPQLIAGPIVRHDEISRQLKNTKIQKLKRIPYSAAMTFISVGLFKKTVLADQLAQVVDAGYDNTASLSMLDTWYTSISFTLQIYYDFSGYTDLAIGSALIMGISIPQNFNSPYKSKSLKEFWKRWHITLSKWFLDYVYKPLGGNRKPEIVVALNLVVTFSISGLWHGAGWNFIVWGLIHGLAIVGIRLWNLTKLDFPKYLNWFLTLAFLNITWIFFRSPNLETAFTLLSKFVTSDSLSLSEDFINALAVSKNYSIFNAATDSANTSFIPVEAFILIGIAIIPLRNSTEMAYKNRTGVSSFLHKIYIGLMLGLATSMLLSGSGNHFIYFEF